MLAIAAIALVFAGSAQAALSVTPTRTFGMASLYAVAADGTFYYTTGPGSGGTIVHTDDEGNDLGDGFSFSYTGYYPLGIGYFENRVYLTVASDYHRLISYQVNSNDPGHDFLATDQETDERIGSNQAMLRVFGDGGMAIAMGQENKVATLTAGDLTTEHPFYPQGFHGAGINKNFTAEPPFALESCVLGLNASPIFGEPDKCGQDNGRTPAQGAPDGLNYPNDIAPGLGGLYISEGGANQITHYNTVANPGATLDLRFGSGPGSAAGQLSGVASIVRQPSTGWLYVSEEGNRRISVFDADGHYIASFGYGVRDGSDTMQVCGVEIGQCQAGVSYLSDARSYFSRLDFSPDGELYAYMPLVGQVQVFGLSGGIGPENTSGAAPKIIPPQRVKDKVRIKAKPLKVPKGKKTKLTAIVSPAATCRQRLVLFQEKEPRSWNNLGKAIKPGKGCTASKRVKVTAKTVYRAVLIKANNHATLAYSPRLTVKLK